MKKIIKFAEVPVILRITGERYPRILSPYFTPKSVQTLGTPSHGDTIIATVRPNRRSFLFIKNPPDNLVVSTGFAVLRAKPEIDSRYLYFAINDQTFTDYLTNNAKGAAYPAVDSEIIGNAKIRVPNLKIQRKIAAIPSAYDDLIENNTRRIQILEEMAQRIYREWFIHFRFPGHEHVNMVDSELGMIPEGWDAIRLKKIANEIRRSVNPNEIDPSTPYLGLEHFPRRSIALQEWGFANHVHSTKYRFNKFEILFGKIRPYFHKVGIAPLNGICSSDTIVIVPNDEKFLYLTLGCVSSKEFVDHATLTSQGTKMPRANWEVLKEYIIALPSNQFLEDFNTTIKPMLLEIINLIFKNRNLRQTRDLLLPKLISGKIDVSALDIDTGDVEK